MSLNMILFDLFVFWGEEGNKRNKHANQMNFSRCFKADHRSVAQNAVSPDLHLK